MTTEGLAYLTNARPSCNPTSGPPERRLGVERGLSLIGFDEEPARLFYDDEAHKARTLWGDGADVEITPSGEEVAVCEQVRNIVRHCRIVSIVGDGVILVDDPQEPMRSAWPHADRGSSIASSYSAMRPVAGPNAGLAIGIASYPSHNAKDKQ